MRKCLFHCEPLERRRLLSSGFAFASAQSFSLSGAAGPIYAGKFHGTSGSTDLAVSTGNAVQILNGTGTGAFTAGQTISYPANPAAGKPFLVGNFRSAETSDIVLLSQSSITGDGLITFEQGTGAGTFISGAASTISDGGAGFEPITAAVGDFNGDGVADLAVIGKPVTGSGLVLAIMQSDTDGTFTETADYPVAGAATTGTPLDEPLIAGNFAGSSIDLALDDGSSGHLDLFLNNGNGTFDAQAPVPLTATLMISTQLTSSGHLDLVTASGETVTPLLGSGNGIFTTGNPVTVPQTITALASGDINLDGNRDIVTNAGILSGNGDGTFSTSISSLPVAFSGGNTVSNTLIAADITGDGRPDVVGFAAAGNAVITLVNQTAAATATSVNSSAEPSNPGEDIKLTATVSTALTTPTPTGSVTFFDGTNPIGAAQLGTGGKATLDAGTGLTLGAHAITVVYGGDGSFAGSTSAVFTQQVLAPTVTTLTVSENPTDAGDPITLSASVTGNDGQGDVPTGAMEFLSGSTPLGELSLDTNGKASLSDFTLTSGTVAPLTAVYQGDDVFAGSTSTAISETVNAAPLEPVVTKSSLPAEVVIGQPPGRASAQIKLTNQTAKAITGPVLIALYLSPSGFIDATATALNSLSRSVNLKAGASTSFGVPLAALPALLASGGYTLLARASFGIAALSTANTGYGTQGPTVQAATADPSLAASVHTRGLAASTVTGTRSKGAALITLTNTGNVLVRGSVTVALSFSATTGTPETAFATLTRTLAIKVDGTQTLTIPLGQLPALADGMYFLVASVSESAITTAIGSGTAAYALVAPVISFQLSIGSVHGRSKAGQSDSINFLLSDTGNVSVAGQVQFTISLVPATGDEPIVVAMLLRTAPIPASGHRSFNLNFLLPNNLPAAEYFPLVTAVQGSVSATTQGTGPILSS